MIKKISAFFSVVLFCFLSISISASADDVYSDDQLASDLYDNILANYQISGEMGEDIIYYIYGRNDGGTGNPIAALWYGSTVHICTYNLQTQKYYYSRFNYAINVSSSHVGRSEVGADFWFTPSSSQTAFISGWTDNIQIDSIAPGHFTQTKAATFEELGASLSSGSSVSDDSGLLDAISGLPSKIGDVFQNSIDGLLDGIKDFFTDLFMPDTDAIAQEWDYIQDKFQFWVDIRDFVEEITASISALDGTPASIEFELTTSGTKWFGGLSGSAVVIDLSWFAPYRSSVHVIISAFIWIAYIWRLFHALPGIISGASGITSDRESSDDNSRFAEDHYKYLGSYAGRR